MSSQIMKHVPYNNPRKAGKTLLAIISLIEKGITVKQVEDSPWCTSQFKKAFKQYVEDNMKKCNNPECNRQTTADYCCAPCRQAHNDHYEIHENGILGHSEGCDERHKERCLHLDVKYVPHPSCGGDWQCSRCLGFWNENPNGNR